MSDLVANCIRTWHIDSYQKLHLLLFLHQQPDIQGTPQEFAEWLHLGDTALLERIVTDLQKAGLVEPIENRYRLRDEPNIRACLQHLVASFEDPLARQEIFDQMKYTRSFNHYHEPNDEAH